MSGCSQLPICLQQGGVFVLQVDYLNEDENAPAIDLTGYEGRLQIRDPLSDTTLLELTTGDNEVTVDDSTGRISATFPLSKINALPTNDRETTGWIYGLQIFDPNDADMTTRLLLTGEVTVKPNPIEITP